jgi:hypothetical protein
LVRNAFARKGCREIRLLVFFSKFEDCGMTEKERFEIILEDINRKMDLLVEGHQNLDQKIDRVAGELRSEMSQMRGELQAEMIGIRDGLRGEMKQMGDGLRGEMKQMGDGLGRKIDIVMEKVLDHERRITALEKQA